MRRSWNMFYMTVASGIIICLSIIMLLSPDKTFSAEENRYLARFPALTWESLRDGSFGEELEQYVADQFPFREYWVTAKAWLEVGLNKKDNHDVYAGKNGYLLQKIPRPTESLDDQTAYMRQFAESLDVPVYVMLAPNSASVMAELLPRWAPVPDQHAYISQACSLLDDAASCVDIYERLDEHHDEYIYYRTDHHWTTLGAYYAYQAYADAAGFSSMDRDVFNIERVSDSFYGSLYARSGFRHVSPDAIDIWIPKSAYTHKVTYADTGDETDSLYAWGHLDNRDQYPLFLDGNHALTVIKTPQAPDRTLLVVKDSYAHSFVPFLTQHYDSIHMVDLRYLNMSVQDYAEEIEADEVLLLYNVASFQEDNNIVKLRW